MSQMKKITFYTFPYSPYAHRVHIALEEAKAAYIQYVVNLADKPAWYAAKVNPAGKVPSLAYGGANSAVPEDPSPESEVIAESLIILEFIADLFPESPSPPTTLCAAPKHSIFIHAFDRVFYGGESADKLASALEHIQKLLPDTGLFAVGEWCIADAAAAPFLARTWMLLEHDIGKYPRGEGKSTLEVLRGPKFARIAKYLEDIKRRASLAATWDENVQLAVWAAYPPVLRTQ
ncbi:thioredoxin-like protein [Polyporus arcularius HHB13444]|uniref:Thioredoxin-like protein n=1 Tax=Polyporus arcularius HHB13444 TaxID=1314778 RepID=A0A5C3PDV3_9APHY|nr:thioredoxin-like protein [Polyporus arcularius HHB13444]